MGLKILVRGNVEEPPLSDIEKLTNAFSMFGVYPQDYPWQEAGWSGLNIMIGTPAAHWIVLYDILKGFINLGIFNKLELSQLSITKDNDIIRA